MNEEFAPYEQALVLKELGFDEPCIRAYHTKEKLCVCSEIGYKNSQGFGMPTAPLYQQAFRWLLVLVNKDEHFSNKWTISYNEDYYTLFLGGCNMGVFKAELECLKKLIELCKKN